MLRFQLKVYRLQQKLWTLKRSVRKNCSTIRVVAQLVENIYEVTIIKRILISTDVNDLGHYQPKEVADEFIIVVNSLRSKLHLYMHSEHSEKPRLEFLQGLYGKNGRGYSPLHTLPVVTGSAQDKYIKLRKANKSLM